MLNYSPINWHVQALSQAVSFMTKQIINLSFLPGTILKRLNTIFFRICESRRVLQGKAQ